MRMYIFFHFFVNYIQTKRPFTPYCDALLRNYGGFDDFFKNTLTKPTIYGTIISDRGATLISKDSNGADTPILKGFVAEDYARLSDLHFLGVYIRCMQLSPVVECYHNLLTNIFYMDTLYGYGGCPHNHFLF